MSNDDQETRVALMLAALGNEIRLRVYRLLVRAGRDGLNVGALQVRTGVPASTLAHHIGALKGAGLIRQWRTGREVICVADYEAMTGLVAYLSDECCADAGGAGGAAMAGDLDKAGSLGASREA